MKLSQISPEFVDEIPRELDAEKLYVCCRYRAVKHLCACGCGVAISTPLHPTGWTLTCDGVSVSLWPSIGNWSEKCQSHYWISRNNIHWAPRWSRNRIFKGRKARALDLENYLSANTYSGIDHVVPERLGISKSLRGWLTALVDLMLRRK